MLPDKLRGLKAYLDKKGIAKRTSQEDELLEDINQVEKTIDKAKQQNDQLVEGIEKRAKGGLIGVTPDNCPTCGKAW